MKIYNDEEWKSVKDGKYKGFSIEGKFDGFEALEQKKQDKMDLIEEVKEIISKGLEMESQSVELADSKKTVDLLTKYNKIKNTARGYYDAKIQSLKVEATKNVELLGDIKDEAQKLKVAFIDLGFDKEAKEIENLQRNAQEDFDVAVEVIDLLKRF
jgi:orotate phosphoribosyltransferase-like protein